MLYFGSHFGFCPRRSLNRSFGIKNDPRHLQLRRMGLLQPRQHSDRLVGNIMMGIDSGSSSSPNILWTSEILVLENTTSFATSARVRFTPMSVSHDAHCEKNMHKPRADSNAQQKEEIYLRRQDLAAFMLHSHVPVHLHESRIPVNLPTTL
jgi:hypothetical protein